MATATARQAKSATDTEQEIIKKDNVIEVGAERDSLRQDIAELQAAIAQLVNKVDDQGEANKARINALVNDAKARDEKADLRMQELEEMLLRQDTAINNLKRGKAPKEEDTRTRAQKIKDLRKMRPRKPTSGEMTFVVITNLAEYLALVGCAQLAPEATAKVIMNVLFI